MDVGKSLPALRRPVSVLDKPLSKGKGEVRAFAPRRANGGRARRWAGR